MFRRPPRSTRTYTPFPYTTLFRSGTREFGELAFRLNRGDPAWVPPLKGEALDLLTPGKNPWFEHGRAQLFVARRDGRTVGRISAHIADLAIAQPAAQGMGPGTGHWGLFARSEEHTSELQSLMRNSYAVFCLKKKTQ